MRVRRRRWCLGAALIGIVLTGAVLAPTAGFAQVSCSRDGLQRAVDLYLAAQTRGDTSGLPLAPGLGYRENLAPARIDDGLIKAAMTIDHQRSLLDPATCQTFTEVIVTNKEHPYVLGTRLRVNRDKIAEIDILWTTTGYWLFNADTYLKYSSTETWDVIPPGQRDSRDTLVAAANAYLDAFLEGKKDLVPWGYPCNRTEGGAHTGNGSPTDSCDVGVPSGVNIANRRFIVDPTIGSVVVFCTFGAGNTTGGSGAPDTHLFRVEHGKLRYVHTLTHLLQSDFRRGAGPPPLTRPAAADELTVLCSNGLKAVLDDLAPKFETATHHKLVVTYGLAASLGQRIKGGEPFDVVFLTPAVVDDLIAAGKISRDTRTQVARSGLALVIRSGTRKPDISTSDTFKRTLLNAQSIAYAKEGASGVLFAATIQRLGIAGDLQSKSLLTATGEAVSDAVVRGDVEFGVLPLSEILPVKGEEAVVFPAVVQSYIVMVGGVNVASTHAGAAAELIKYVTAPATLSVLTAKGMER